MTELQLEIRAQENLSPEIGPIVMTPPINEDYWKYRVRLSDKQAIVGFPKFFTIGIGFAVEDADWNTNLPYRCAAHEIYEHIEHNKGDDAIDPADCVRAIEMVRQAAIADHGQPS